MDIEKGSGATRSKWVRTATFCAATLLGASVWAATANAGCSQAIANKFNKLSNSENKTFVRSYEQAVGGPPTSVPFKLENCAKLLPVYRARLPVQEQLAKLYQPECAHWDNRIPGLKGPVTPTQIIAGVNEYISDCERYLAEQEAAKTPSTVAQVPEFRGGQSADCSDITGTNDTSTSRRDCAPRKGAPQDAGRQPEQKRVPQINPVPGNAPPSAADQLRLIDQLGKPEEVAKGPEPATPPTIFVRPPTHTALDLELQRQMEQLQISDPTDCDKSLRATINDINAKILELQKQEPRWEPGPQVGVGTCTSRLHKLFGHDFGLSNTSVAKQVENREARGCLELKKAYLEQACKCASKGITLSTDEAIQDQTLEAASSVRDLETRARNRGIPNERIRAIVTRAAEIRDCYNIQTVETLRSTEQALERELGFSSGQSSPPASPPLNKPQ